MQYLCTHWGAILYLIGSICDIAGVCLMASRYTKVLWRQRPWVIVSAIWRGKRARLAAEYSNAIPDNGLTILQGLGLVAVGFALQMLQTIRQVVTG